MTRGSPYLIETKLNKNEKEEDLNMFSSDRVVDLINHLRKELSRESPNHKLCHDSAEELYDYMLHCTAKPCPFCGCGNTNVVVVLSLDTNASVECANCGARAPTAADKELAYEAWNARV